MTQENPLRKKYTWPARIAVFFLVVGLLADVLAFYTLLATRHAGGLAGMGAGYFALLAIVVGVVSYAIGALVASGGRHLWRGVGERRIGLLCLGGMIAGPLIGFACLASA